MKRWVLMATVVAAAAQLRCRVDDRSLTVGDQVCGPMAICPSADAEGAVEVGVDASVGSSMDAKPDSSCPSASDPRCADGSTSPSDSSGQGAENPLGAPGDAAAEGGGDAAAEGGRDAAAEGGGVDAGAENGVEAGNDVREACAPNECGGCAALLASPGTPCGQCGMYVCGGEGESVYCQDPAHRSVQSIAGGYYHTCVLTTDGGVRCWGFNMYGQLGDGTNTDRYAPDKTDVLTGVQAIASGGMHVCALMMSGGVKCWGFNEAGQLGDGSTTSHSTPVDVVTPSGLLAGVRAIAAGYEHTCVLMMNGGLRCWGLNTSGQLGDGTTTGRFTPASTDQLTGIQQISLGLYDTCALTSSGVQCWGYNLSGQIGDGTTVNQPNPTSVMTSTGTLGSVLDVAAGGYHTCVVMPTTSGVRCWGANGFGELGDGTTVSRLSTPDADGLSAVAAIATGSYHTCALTMAGGVRCWGRNLEGQIGDGTTGNRSAASVSDTLTGVTAIAAGNLHSCAVTANGVRCWGLNMFGQVGDGTTTNRSTPTEVTICP